jgi:hypothetical protein
MKTDAIQRIASAILEEMEMKPVSEFRNDVTIAEAAAREYYEQLDCSNEDWKYILRTAYLTGVLKGIEIVRGEKS